MFLFASTGKKLVANHTVEGAPSLPSPALQGKLLGEEFPMSKVCGDLPNATVLLILSDGWTEEALEIGSSKRECLKL
ncbi:hypothetical protein CEXT_41871 [Caerostris extrusa]|uniref:PPM-type phosphatase domain-containing protein n=1 Tax=Caerostris extrusa TaxID=172846 RepID=A0AAV4M986_CAEEX|nr:hypothetical protein CEXT_41871 [Caerostris extrusa]